MKGILMTEGEQSCPDGSRTLVLAVAPGASSETGLGPELRGGRAGSHSQAFHCTLQYHLWVKTLLSGFQGTPITGAQS